MDEYGTELEAQTWMPADEELADPLGDYVLGVLAAHLELRVESLSRNAHLMRELGITPLWLVVIGLEIEDVRRIDLPFEELIRVSTVGGLIELVRRCSV